jgi:hypothetical protein
MAVLGVAWIAAVAVSVVARDAVAPYRLAELSLAYPAMYLALSFWIGGLHRKPA